MDVLALPDGGNLDAGNDLEPDLLRGLFGQLERVEVVVVGDGNAAQSLALAKFEKFLDFQVSVGELCVEVQVREPTAFGDDGGSLLH